ncbi:hypothetical protein V6N13_042906 [Hibiscus sabdariffa]
MRKKLAPLDVECPRATTELCNLIHIDEEYDRVVPYVIRARKCVRVETNNPVGAISISFFVVELAIMKLPKSSHPTAGTLVIRAGKFVISHLVSKDCTKMVIVNRSEEKVATIRE